MSSTARRSHLTQAASGRARLYVEFSARGRAPTSPRADPDELELPMEHVARVLADPGVGHELRVADAVAADLATWPRALRRTPARTRDLLTAHVLDTACDPVARRIVAEEIGPRPEVRVALFLSRDAHGLSEVDVTVVYRGVPRAAEDLDALAEAMLPKVPVPSAPVVLQARRNAEARASLLDEFGALTATQVAVLAGSAAKNTSALAGRWRREGRLVAVEHRGTTYYPGFQFDADGQPRPVVGEALVHLGAPDTTPWQQALWFTTANGWLDGRRPVDLLEDEPGAVVMAATETLREPVG